MHAISENSKFQPYLKNKSGNFSPIFILFLAKGKLLHYVNIKGRMYINIII